MKKKCLIIFSLPHVHNWELEIIGKFSIIFDIKYVFANQLFQQGGSQFIIEHCNKIITEENIEIVVFDTEKLAELKDEGQCSSDLEHRQVKHLNNIIESDHGKLKRLIKPTVGFKTMKTAYATIKGFEVMRMFKKDTLDFWKYGQGIQGEINRKRLVKVVWKF